MNVTILLNGRTYPLGAIELLVCAIVVVLVLVVVYQFGEETERRKYVPVLKETNEERIRNARLAWAFARVLPIGPELQRYFEWLSSNVATVGFIPIGNEERALCAAIAVHSPDCEAVRVALFDGVSEEVLASSELRQSMHRVHSHACLAKPARGTRCA